MQKSGFPKMRHYVGFSQIGSQIYAKICILMVSSVLCITSQVEHTKEYNGIASESRFVKQNADHQNHLTVCFYMLLQHHHIVRKRFCLEQSALA